jgi:hypothetical protein
MGLAGCSEPRQVRLQSAPQYPRTYARRGEPASSRRSTGWTGYASPLPVQPPFAVGGTAMRKTPKSLTPAQRDRIAGAYSNGEPIKVIAGRFGIHETTVIKVATGLGVPKRYQRSTARTLGLAAVRLGLTMRDLELLAQLRGGGQPVRGGPDQFGELRQ